jgi:hypothetical protein
VGFSPTTGAVTAAAAGVASTGAWATGAEGVGAAGAAAGVGVEVFEEAAAGAALAYASSRTNRLFSSQSPVSDTNSYCYPVKCPIVQDLFAVIVPALPW